MEQQKGKALDCISQLVIQSYEQYSYAVYELYTVNTQMVCIQWLQWSDVPVPAQFPIQHKTAQLQRNNVD